MHVITDVLLDNSKHKIYKRIEILAKVYCVVFHKQLYVFFKLP